jgi:hypothetical protein
LALFVRLNDMRAPLTLALTEMGMRAGIANLIPLQIACRETQTKSSG